MSNYLKDVFFSSFFWPPKSIMAFNSLWPVRALWNCEGVISYMYSIVSLFCNCRRPNVYTILLEFQV